MTASLVQPEFASAAKAKGPEIVRPQARFLAATVCRGLTAFARPAARLTLG